MSRYAANRVNVNAGECASSCESSALVLTIDLQVLGQRHRDVHNGLTVPPEVLVCADDVIE